MHITVYNSDSNSLLFCRMGIIKTSQVVLRINQKHMKGPRTTSNI